VIGQGRRALPAVAYLYCLVRFRINELRTELANM